MCTAQAIEPDQRPDTTPFDRELLAIAAIDQGYVVDIDHRFFQSFEDSLQTNRNPSRICRKDGAAARFALLAHLVHRLVPVASPSWHIPYTAWCRRNPRNSK